jgi:hypothetical protein
VTTDERILENVETCEPDTFAPIEWQEKIPRPTLSQNALYGPAGEFVRIVEPHSEADLAALLAQHLGAFSCAAGPSPYFQVEATKHPLRLNIIIVGVTASGRKGTSLDQVKRLYRIADEEWLDRAKLSSLTSGEGLMANLRDGGPDKRRWIVETEFVRTIAACSRDGSILSPVLRDGWDDYEGRLRHPTKKDAIAIDGAHFAISGHITADELRAKLPSTEIANGFANRFLFVCAKRRQRLPHGGTLADRDVADVGKRLRAALEFARGVREMHRTPKANRLWESFYHAVPEPAGLLGAVTARPEAQVLRLSMAYALLDCSDRIDEKHIGAALAFWRYSYESAQHIFGGSLGDKVADRILEAVRDGYPRGLDREAIAELFHRHASAADVRSAVDLLKGRRLVREASEAGVGAAGTGRSRIVTYAVPPGEESEISAESTQGDYLTTLISLSSQAFMASTNGATLL